MVFNELPKYSFYESYSSPLVWLLSSLLWFQLFQSSQVQVVLYQPFDISYQEIACPLLECRRICFEYLIARLWHQLDTKIILWTMFAHSLINISSILIPCSIFIEHDIPSRQNFLQRRIINSITLPITIVTLYYWPKRYGLI